MPRLFVALEVPRNAAMSLSLLRGGLPGARWIDVENFHITLRFIGVGGLMYTASSVQGSFEAPLDCEFDFCSGTADFLA